MLITNSYHQTTNLTLGELRQRIEDAEHQDEMILAAFDCGMARSPSQIHNMLSALGKKMPITSVRRSISNLTRVGALVKTSEQRRGPYGHAETLWERPCSSGGLR